MSERKKVVIIGGGITGLAAAYYIQKDAREQGLPLDITLIEASIKLGGKIQTVRRDGYVIERGPDSFLIRKQSVDQLASDLGIADQLVRNATGQAYILLHNHMHKIPAGAVMGVPTEVKPFVTSGLFSVSGKVRAAGDLILPRSEVTGDQSLGKFFRRRFGTEVVENLIEPLLSGVYAGDIDHMSLESTFPQFYEVEKKHRSLILGMKKTTPKQLPQKNSHSSKKMGAFHTFRNGLESLTEALEEQLTDITVMKGTRVIKVEKQGDSAVLTMGDQQKIEADAVIMATSHTVASRLFEPYGLLNELGTIPTTSVATVALGYPKHAMKKEIDGTGFLVPRSSNHSITACTLVDRKWPTTTPDDKVMVRAFVGRVGEEAIVDLPDSEIEKIVRKDLGEILGLEGEPEFCIITRWKDDRPQYRVGHKDKILRAREELQSEFPMIQLAGASYNGVGLPDCIDQGVAAKDEVLARLFS
ncbi:protoporphyrinogen oxidase [Sporosarcina sp. P37]|uniref:protoporphyrinogen oxidase n=1 Tax=unclassified Sporosarcina TaxID=2647733 RepID=UPI000A17DAEB|nr:MULTISPECIES: protoporphyrinogen oxidase [unclassified Sporosarcina]ARK25491.1 protoporphyrinogen oxidase [Sporosarcina sp. P37]PID17978.1 protoporphyrinogen oxidase [Sporosarcina sp. P35]